MQTQQRPPLVRRIVTGITSVISWLAMVATGIWIAGIVLLAFLHVVDVERLTRFVVIFEAMTPGVVLAAFPFLIVAWAGRRQRQGVVCGVVIAALAVSMATSFIGKSSPAGGTPVSIFDQNVEGSTNRTPHDTTRAMLNSGADIVTIQETTDEFEATIRADHVMDRYPHTYRNGDLAIYSRASLTQTSATFTVHVDFLRTVISVGKASFVLYDVHFPTPVFQEIGPWIDAFQKLDLAIHRETLPVVVTGDFNATTDHHQFNNLLRDGFHEGNSDVAAGIERTWPVHPAWATSLGGVIRIDHVVLNQITATSIKAGEPNGSDHRPVAIQMTVPNP